MVMLYNSAAPTQAPASGALAIGTGGVVPSTGFIARLNPAAAVTGVIVQQGTYNGQQLWVINEAAAANTVTFAASGTSFVADGATTALAGVTGRLMVWDAAAALWFRSA